MTIRNGINFLKRVVAEQRFGNEVTFEFLKQIGVPARLGQKFGVGLVIYKIVGIDLSRMVLMTSICARIHEQYICSCPVR